MSQERRGFERVEYPEDPRPVLIVGGRTLVVLDCAERGLRYEANAGTAGDVGADVRGVIRFPSGPEVRIEGVVVRADADGIAVHFTELWIDKEVMEGERRRLRGPGHFARENA